MCTCASHAMPTLQSEFELLNHSLHCTARYQFGLSWNGTSHMSLQHFRVCSAA